MTTYVFFCDHCGAVVRVSPTGVNARVSAVCQGQQEMRTFTNGQEDPVEGNHEPKHMRQVGLG